MRWIGILLALVVLMSVPAYAQIGAVRAGVRTERSVEVNREAGTVRAAATVQKQFVVPVEKMTPEQRARYKEYVMNMLVRQFGEEKIREFEKKGIRPEKLAEQILEKRERATRAVSVSRDQIQRWENITKKYTQAVRRIREAAIRFAKKQREWAEYRKMYENGEIDENTYLEKSKEMILAAIDATIDRLESVKDREIVEDTSDIDQAIEELQQIREEVENAQTLEELRAIYKEEVLPKVKRFHDRVFAKYYIKGTLRAAESIIARLDVAASRLTRFVEIAKNKGIYDEDMDARVNEIFAEIEAVKAELESLKAEVDASDIESPREYIAKINDIKKDVVEIYRDIKDLIVDYNKKFAAKVRAGAKVSEEQEDVEEEHETEVEEESNASVEEEHEEENVTAEVDEEHEETNTVVEEEQEEVSVVTEENEETNVTTEEETNVTVEEETNTTVEGESNITKEEQNTSVEVNA